MIFLSTTITIQHTWPSPSSPGSCVATLLALETANPWVCRRFDRVGSHGLFACRETWQRRASPPNCWATLHKASSDNWYIQCAAHINSNYSKWQWGCVSELIIFHNEPHTITDESYKGSIKVTRPLNFEATFRSLGRKVLGRKCDGSWL